MGSLTNAESVIDKNAAKRADEKDEYEFNMFIVNSNTPDLQGDIRQDTLTAIRQIQAAKRRLREEGYD